MMTKLEALAMLSDQQNLQAAMRDAAERIGITYQAVSQWPDVLTPPIEDRVIAAWFRCKQRSALDRLLLGAQARKIAAIEPPLPDAALMAQVPVRVVHTRHRVPARLGPVPGDEVDRLDSADIPVPSEPDDAHLNIANPFRV